MKRPLPAAGSARLALAIVVLAAGPAAAEDTAPESAVTPAEGRICVTNASDARHFFAVEAPDGARRTRPLPPGGSLCIPAGTGTGVVAVYESADAFEGCSRIVPAGTAEPMRRYASFDRCAWGADPGGS